MSAIVIGPTTVAPLVTDDIVTGERVHRTKVSATIHVGNDQHDLWFVHDADIEPVGVERGNIWLPLGLLAGMVTGQPVVCADPASELFVENLHEVQEIWSFWYGWDKVDLTAPVTPAPGRFARRPTARGTGTFFTGGIDSFHTLLRHRDELDYLVYGYGYEFLTTYRKRTAQLRAVQARIAAATGTRMLTADTNVRPFIKTYSTWGRSYAPALCALGHVFSSVVDKVYLPAAYTYGEARASGSSPLVDHWWSSSQVRIRNDGAATTRFEKLRTIVDDDLVVDNLRVCGRYQELLNCGECLKCVGAMVSLQVLGRLDRIRSFPDAVDPATVRAIVPTGRLSFINLEHYHAMASTVDGMEEIAEAIRWVIDEWTRRFDEQDALEAATLTP